MAAVGGLLWSRPGDEGMPYDDYFRTLNQELKANGPMRPSLVLDLDRIDHNIDQVVKSAGRDKAFRIVAKSLPSGPLLDYVAKRAATQRLMVFHQPFLNAQARLFPDSDLLLGKPLPVRSAALFYRDHQGAFQPERQLQWLLDTPARLRQYLDLARAQNLRLNINIELDVGLHRGGVTASQGLPEMLALIRANPKELQFGGFMGYDPHVVKIPGLLASRETLFQRVLTAYGAALDLLRRDFPGLEPERPILNTAGSPTYKLHEGESIANEIAVGSAIVKPADFDIDTLADHQAAAFIATPVLKAKDGLQLAGLDDKANWIAAWDINQRRTYYSYGGYWKARYENPQGLRNNALFGHSTNQEMVNGSPRTGLKVDDQIFLRPTQSEFVFLQFGDLIATRAGKIVDYWPVFS